MEIKEILDRANTLCLVAGLCLLMPGASMAAAEIINLRAADLHPADYPTVLAVNSMAKQLSEQTDGRINLKMYSGAQLGTEKATLEITIFGGIDINRTSLAPMNSIAPQTGVLSLPFLFRSTEHMRKVVDGPIGDEILATLEPHGLIGLAFYDSGASFSVPRQCSRHHAQVRDQNLNHHPFQSDTRRCDCRADSRCST